MAAATAVSTIKHMTEGVLHVSHIGVVRNILLGAGLAYAMQKEKYWHIPIAFVTPAVYVGYHAYTQRDSLRAETVAIVKELR